MSKGVKISCTNKDNLHSIVICSECLYIVERPDKYCYNCGAVMQPTPVGGSIDYVVKIRDSYREEEKTGWEDEDDD